MSRATTTPDLVLASVTYDALCNVTRDADVLRISSDAPVIGSAAKTTSSKSNAPTKTTTATSSPTTTTTTATKTTTTTTATGTTSTKPTTTATTTSTTLSSLAVKLSGTSGYTLPSNALLQTLGIKATPAERLLSFVGRNVGVAIIDSGIDPNMLDLDQVQYFDFLNGGVAAQRADAYGHGTHVSGLMASNGITSLGQYQGVAPGASIVALRVLDAMGNGYTSDVIDAINFAVANKDTLNVRVINLSLGHPIYEPAATDPLVQAVEDAVANGIVVVVAAGNFGGDSTTHAPKYAGITSPGNAPSAITVGAVETLQTATRSDDSLAWFSSRGPSWYDAYQKPDVVAPGSHLVSNISYGSTLYKTYPGGLVTAGVLMPYFRMSGTSMAAPVVSGIVATMIEASLAQGQSLTPNAIKAMLQYTAIPLAGADTLSQGAGMVNANGAVTLASAVNPKAARGSWWLTSSVTPATMIDGVSLAWGQRVVWGDRVIWGDQIFNNDPAWGLRVVWGDRVIWGDRVVWGDSTVWSGNEAVWGSRVVWGDSLLTMGTRVVWGDLQSVGIAPTTISWGNLERANGDLLP